MPLTRQGTRALGPDSEIKVKAQFSKRHLSILLYTEGDRQEKAIAANATCYRDPSREPQIPASLTRHPWGGGQLIYIYWFRPPASCTASPVTSRTV